MTDPSLDPFEDLLHRQPLRSASLDPISPPSARPGERTLLALGRVSTEGPLLADVLGLLETSQSTGVFSVHDGPGERAFFLRSGGVAGSASTIEGDSLGHFLVRRGRLTEDQRVRGATPRWPRGPEMPEELSRLYRARIGELLDAALAQATGQWTWSTLSEPFPMVAPEPLPVHGLLLEAMRRADEMRVYRRRIRSSKAILRKIESPKRPSSTGGHDPVDESQQGGPLDRDSMLVAPLLAALFRPASVEELARRLGWSTYETTRAAYRLLRANLLEVVPEEPENTSRVPDELDADQVRDTIHVYAMAIREIVQDVTRAGNGEPIVAQLSRFVADEAGPSVSARVLKCVRFSAGGALDQEALARGLRETAVTAGELNDALSELLFLALLSATDHLGRREGENLARRVKMIHGMLAGQADVSA